MMVAFYLVHSSYFSVKQVDGGMWKLNAFSSLPRTSAQQSALTLSCDKRTIVSGGMNAFRCHFHLMTVMEGVILAHKKG